MKNNTIKLVAILWLAFTLLFALYGIYSWPVSDANGEELIKLQQERNETDREQLEANEPYLEEKERLQEEANLLRESIREEARQKEVKEVEPLVEEMFTRVEWMIWTPYILWGKSRDWIDCSWLFALFWVEKWITSEEYMIHVGNSYNIFKRKTTPIVWAKRWDILFFDSMWSQPNHIALVERFLYYINWEASYDIIDASYANWVSRRTITVKNWYYEVDWYTYEVYEATNPMLIFERDQYMMPQEKVKEPVEEAKDWFYLSHYNVWDPRQNDETPCIWAAGANICKVLEWGDQSIALVRPYREKHGIKWWDRVVLEWDDSCRGEYIVLDEMNKRFRNPNDSQCVKNNHSPHCIRWDIAYPLWQKWLGGNCYIKEVIKH